MFQVQVKTPIVPARAERHARSHSSSSVSNLKGKSWFLFSSSSSSATTPPPQKPNKFAMTVLNLVRDLVPGSLQPPASYRACNSHNVSISEILQEKFIESHSPLYWAIVKRRQPDAHDDLGDPTEPDLLDALIRQLLHWPVALSCLHPIEAKDTASVRVWSVLFRHDEEGFPLLARQKWMFSATRRVSPLLAVLK